jgi:hypothetical protein
VHTGFWWENPKKRGHLKTEMWQDNMQMDLWDAEVWTEVRVRWQALVNVM